MHGKVTLWNAFDGQILTEARKHVGEIEAIAFGPDGLTLASGVSDWSARVWDVPSLNERAVHRVSSQFITALAFSPDNRTLFSADFHGNDQGGLRWDVMTREQQAMLFRSDSSSGVNCMALSPDGTVLAATGMDEKGSVQLWDIVSGRKLIISEDEETLSISGATKLAFTSDSKYLVTYGGQVRNNANFGCGMLVVASV